MTSPTLDFDTAAQNKNSLSSPVFNSTRDTRFFIDYKLTILYYKPAAHKNIPAVCGMDLLDDKVIKIKKPTFFHVIQECLNNRIRHATNLVSIHAIYADAIAEPVIADDGIGFAPKYNNDCSALKTLQRAYLILVTFLSPSKQIHHVKAPSIFQLTNQHTLNKHNGKNYNPYRRRSHPGKGNLELYIKYGCPL